ncbi:MAG: Helix-turn-helix domain [Pseudomonadota bacterium]|jgi:transcriptional regulator with XRE-family HTH domain
MSTNFDDFEQQRDYRSHMLRSAVVSTFWSAISTRREAGMKLIDLAEKLKINKSAISRWFSGPTPNWSVSTISDLAHVLDVDVEITLRDRKTGEIYTSTGKKPAEKNDTPPREAA